MMQSLIATGWARDVARAQAHMRARCNAIETFLQKVPVEDKLTIDYDDLLAHPVETCVRLARLAGVDDKARIASAAASIKPELSQF